MRKIAIIGSGFAGISAYLNCNHQTNEISIFEQQKEIGGRTRSFSSDKFEFDSGQHLLMQAYIETLDLIKKLGSTSSLLKIEALEYRFKVMQMDYKLKAFHYLPAPLHIIYSFISFCKPLNLWNRLKFVIPGLAFLLPNTKKNKNRSAKQWLNKYQQNELHFRFLWDILVKSIFNTNSENVSAYQFISIFRILFFKNRNFAKAIIPSKPLSSLFKNFASIVENNNDQLKTACRIKEIKRNDNKVILSDQKNKRYEFDLVILATPPEITSTLLNLGLNFKRSGILTIYFTSEDELFEDYFLGFPEENFEWLFNFNKINQNKYYSAVISDFTLNDEDLITFLNNFKTNISRIFNVEINTINIIQHFFDTKATYLDTIDNKNRPEPGFIKDKILICGDWTDTGLPGTIESAVISGKKISEIINNLD